MSRPSSKSTPVASYQSTVGPPHDRVSHVHTSRSIFRSVRPTRARIRPPPTHSSRRRAPSRSRTRRRRPRVMSDCHFAVQLNHFMPGFLSYSVPVFLKRQSGITPGHRRGLPAHEAAHVPAGRRDHPRRCPSPARHGGTIRQSRSRPRSPRSLVSSTSDTRGRYGERC